MQWEQESRQTPVLVRSLDSPVSSELSLASVAGLTIPQSFAAIKEDPSAPMYTSRISATRTASVLAGERLRAHLISDWVSEGPWRVGGMLYSSPECQTFKRSRWLPVSILASARV
eukprot:7844723-Alexandrium_andersonii.AAC.1